MKMFIQFIDLITSSLLPEISMFSCENFRELIFLMGFWNCVQSYFDLTQDVICLRLFQCDNKQYGGGAKHRFAYILNNSYTFFIRTSET
jgi:hypothetical protein